MAVKIRLSRIGKKNAPMYRIVAIDSRKKRDGQAIEDLGTYNPVTGEIVQFHQERINAWIAQGAIPTDSVLKLQKMYKRQQPTAA
jgi:small subunit ribosomal protein S16